MLTTPLWPWLAVALVIAIGLGGTFRQLRPKAVSRRCHRDRTQR